MHIYIYRRLTITMVIPLNRGASGEGECLCLVFLVITLSAIQSHPSISICARIMCVCWHSCAYCPGVTTVDSTYICIAMFLCGIIIRSCYGHRQHNHRHRHRTSGQMYSVCVVSPHIPSIECGVIGAQYVICTPAKMCRASGFLVCVCFVVYIYISMI